MNEVCKGTRLGIPCLIASDSRNENDEESKILKYKTLTNVVKSALVSVF